MEKNRFNSWLTKIGAVLCAAVLFAVLALVVVWCIIAPVVNYVRTPSEITEITEIRMYLRFFLFLFAVMVFGVLRLYNSIVKNTLFLVKLRETLAPFIRAFPGIEKTVRTNTNTENSLKGALDRLSSSIEEATEMLSSIKDKK